MNAKENPFVPAPGTNSVLPGYRWPPSSTWTRKTTGAPETLTEIMAVISRRAHTRRPLKPGTSRHSLLDVEASLTRTAEDWRSRRDVLVNAITTIGTATTVAT